MTNKVKTEPKKKSFFSLSPETANGLVGIASLAQNLAAYEENKRVQSQQRNKQRWAEISSIQAEANANKRYLESSAIAKAQLRNSGHGGEYSSPNLEMQKLKDIQQLDKEKRAIKLNAKIAMANLGVQAATTGENAATQFGLNAVTGFADYFERAEEIRNIREFNPETHLVKEFANDTEVGGEGLHRKDGKE